MCAPCIGELEKSLYSNQAKPYSATRPLICCVNSPQPCVVERQPQPPGSGDVLQLTDQSILRFHQAKEVRWDVGGGEKERAEERVKARESEKT